MKKVSKCFAAIFGLATLVLAASTTACSAETASAPASEAPVVSLSEKLQAQGFVNQNEGFRFTREGVELSSEVFKGPDGQTAVTALSPEGRETGIVIDDRTQTIIAQLGPATDVSLVGRSMADESVTKEFGRFSWGACNIACHGWSNRCFWICLTTQ